MPVGGILSSCFPIRAPYPRYSIWKQVGDEHLRLNSLPDTQNFFKGTLEIGRAHV